MNWGCKKYLMFDPNHNLLERIIKKKNHMKNTPIFNACFASVLL